MTTMQEFEKAAPQLGSTMKCALLLTKACRKRGGATNPPEGFLAIVDGRPLLICGDCRRLLKLRPQKSAGVEEV